LKNAHGCVTTTTVKIYINISIRRIVDK